MSRATRRRAVVLAAVAPLFAAAPVGAAIGDWVGHEVAPIRMWNNPINWDLNAVPVSLIDPINFSTNGDGVVDMGAIYADQPSFTFNDWTSYTLNNGTIATSTINVAASVQGGVNGTAYFTDGNVINADLDLTAGPMTINFTHADTGILYLGGNITGGGSLTTNRTLASGFVRPVFVDQPNAGFFGPVNINVGTLIRLMDAGRVGTGLISLVGGQVEIVSNTGAQVVVNPVTSVNGSFFANHNHSVNPYPIYSPLATTHMIGPVMLDNPNNVPVPGFGPNDASISFGGNNNYSFASPMLVLTNGQPPVPPPILAGIRYVRVQNGNRTGGFVGSVRLTSPNRLNEELVTTTFGTPGPAPGLMDWDPIGLAGLTLSKYGTGIMAIDGDNTAYGPGIGSAGPKFASEGVIRFNNPLAFGGPIGVPAPVTLYTGFLGGPPVSAAMGLGYDPGFFAPPLPANLFTDGTIPGQSGALDIDTPVYTTPFAPGIVSTTAPFPMTAMRLGSSAPPVVGATIVAPVAPYDDFAALTSTWYLGGGGGQLTIAGPWAAPLFPGATVEMGTTGQLLPGRVNITTPLPFGPPLGMVNIRAGTLDLSPLAVVAASAGTSLGTYSTTIGVDGVYAGAPAATPYNAPGQLLLDAATQAGAGYFYGPGPFGAAGLILDGGAIGWAPTLGPGPLIIPVLGVPGAYGVPMPSTLYTSAGTPGPAVATNILHFGGEHSTGMITPMFGIGNNGAIPVALIKSGVDSILDLRMVPAHPHSGGTAILGGEVWVNTAGQLGIASGAVTIGDGGNLYVTAGGPPAITFPQLLRAANAIGARASIVQVDPGITANFTVNIIEAATAGSLFEKRGLGTLSFVRGGAGFLYPSTAANTWGIKAMEGLVRINQLPGITTVTNGAAVFGGGTLSVVPPPVAIPAARLYSPNYGFGGLSTYDATSSFLTISGAGFGSMFRVTGGQTSNLLGTLDVSMSPGNAVFKIAGDAASEDTRGTGTVNFTGGFVQFTPGGGNILWPRDTGFTMSLTGTAFAGCPDADLNGNLTLNGATIDGAIVDNTPTAFASTWTIGGTGDTTWIGTTIKGQTEAVPGAGGPYVSGTVNLDRDLGSFVTLTAGAVLQIDYGILNAGGTGDPFTDTAFPANHLPIVNNASFNITQAYKHVQSIAGVGMTTVNAGAILDVGSIGPVSQSNFTVNGTADVGDVTVPGTTAVGASPALLDARHIRGGTLAIATGDVKIKQSSFAIGVSKVTTVVVAAGGKLDLRDNKLITQSAIGTHNGVNYTGITGLIESGRNAGVWDGDGITTSMTDATSGSGYTMLGVATGQEVKGLALPTDTDTWAGQTVTGNSTLVMYTYGGDANLSGNVDVDDYGLIDFNAAVGGVLTGWYNGDFDYNGFQDVDDYGIIDFVVGIQGAPFFTAGGLGMTVSTVPEPTAVCGLGAISAVMAMRRRRGNRIQG